VSRLADSGDLIVHVSESSGPKSILPENKKRPVRTYIVLSSPAPLTEVASPKGYIYTHDTDF